MRAAAVVVMLVGSGVRKEPGAVSGAWDGVLVALVLLLNPSDSVAFSLSFLAPSENLCSFLLAGGLAYVSSSGGRRVFDAPAGAAFANCAVVGNAHADPGGW